MGIAKLSTDQAVPTGGISAIALVICALLRRGIAVGLSMAALVVGLVSYDASFLTMLAVMLVIPSIRGTVSLPVLAVAGAFAAVAISLPAATLWLRRRGAQALPRVLAALPGVAWLLQTLTRAPADLLRDKRVLVETALLQAIVFLLGAATLWTMLLAAYQTTLPAAASAAFVMASLVAAIGTTPLGLGTFEASRVLTLRLFAVPLEAALAGALLLRGLTSWLPMLPGLCLTRRELRAEA